MRNDLISILLDRDYASNSGTLPDYPLVAWWGDKGDVRIIVLGDETEHGDVILQVFAPASRDPQDRLWDVGYPPAVPTSFVADAAVSAEGL